MKTFLNLVVVSLGMLVMAFGFLRLVFPEPWMGFGHPTLGAFAGFLGAAVLRLAMESRRVRRIVLWALLVAGLYWLLESESVVHFFHP